MSTLVANHEQLAEFVRRLEEEEALKAELATERLQRIAERKRAEKDRMNAARGVPKKRSKQKPVQLGQPTWERSARSAHGFESEAIAGSGDTAIIRSQEKSPLTPPEAGKRTTFLDKAVQDEEARALFRYFVGAMVADKKMRLTGEDGRQPEFVRSDSTNKLPFNECERLEIGAYDHVRSRLPEQSQVDMEILIDQLHPRDKNNNSDRLHLSPIAQGKMISASSDDRVAKGAYIGNYRKLAHHLCFLYLEWEMNQFRLRRERKALVKRQDASLEHFF